MVEQNIRSPVFRPEHYKDESRRHFFDQLAETLAGDEFWADYLAGHINHQRPNQNLHVGVFVQPFLQWIFDGTKTVESRFSKNEILPYGQVLEGDVLLLKEAGGPIRGIARANAAWFYRLDAKTWDLIKDRFSDPIGATGDEFWESRQEARYATLVSLDNVRKFAPIAYQKSDRRGWVMERAKYAQMSLDL